MASPRVDVITHYVQVQADHGAWVDHVALWNCDSDVQAQAKLRLHVCQFPDRPHRIIRHQGKKS